MAVEVTEVMTTMRAGALKRVPACEARKLWVVMLVVGGTVWQLVGSYKGASAVLGGSQ